VELCGGAFRKPANVDSNFFVGREVGYVVVFQLVFCLTIKSLNSCPKISVGIKIFLCVSPRKIKGFVQTMKKVSCANEI
jgi:hypothetical protein